MRLYPRTRALDELSIRILNASRCICLVDYKRLARCVKYRQGMLARLISEIIQTQGAVPPANDPLE